MPRKKKETKVEKVEIPKGIPPKPQEKLVPGQILYAWHPVNGYKKRVYEREYGPEGQILCRDETGQGWIMNIEHLHKTILTKEEYEKLG